MFDLDGDGFLSRSELEAMMKALLEIKLENSGEKVRMSVLFYLHMVLKFCFVR